MPDLSINDWRKLASEDTSILGIVECDNFSPTSQYLVNDLRKLYQKTYTADQRIVILITKDYYLEQPAGLMLQAVQRMVNQIDISNFFINLITTNPQIEEEYSWAMSNISTDPIPFHITRLAGEFTKVLEHNEKEFLWSNVLRNGSFLDKKMSKQHTDLLFNSKSFCMLPWVSMYTKTDSDVSVCCRSTANLGDCSKKTLTEIWNDDVMRQLRLDMLNNKKIDSCQNCYDRENIEEDRHSNRLESLKEYGHLISLVDTTTKNGSVTTNPIWLTTKINNLCNLTCRMCNPTSSSSWHAPAIALGLLPKGSKPLLSAGKQSQHMLDQIVPLLPSLDMITFEGGEPLMIEEFWYILERLDQLQRYEINLHFNTNLTRSQLKNKSIFDYWKKFNHVYVVASLDGEGARGEYLRPGAPWSDVLKFRQEMIARSPNVFFDVKCTVSIINALHIPDFHRSWVEKGLITPQSFILNLLKQPHYLNLRTAPEPLRQQIIDKYTRHLEWLLPLDPRGQSSSCYASAIKFISAPLKFDYDLFWKENGKLDDYHNVELLKIFPELSYLCDHP